MRAGISLRYSHRTPDLKDEAVNFDYKSAFIKRSGQHDSSCCPQSCSSEFGHCGTISRLTEFSPPSGAWTKSVRAPYFNLHSSFRKNQHPRNVYRGNCTCHVCCNLTTTLTCARRFYSLLYAWYSFVVHDLNANFCPVPFTRISAIKNTKRCMIPVNNVKRRIEARIRSQGNLRPVGGL